MASPSSHSKVVGGSNAARVLACPGSIDLVAKAPPSQSSIYAEEGTALHSAMEYLLAHGENRRPADLLGLTFNNHAMTEELIEEAIEPAFKHFVRHIGLEAQYMLEVSAEFPGIPGAFGTTDVVDLPSDDELIIWDWKMGKGVPVPAENNAQLQFYACAILTAQNLWRTVKWVKLHICQPRIEGGNSKWEISVDQLRAFRHSLIRAVNGPRTLATGSHCKWCAGAPFCPQRKAENEAILKWKLAGPELGRAMAAIPELKAWISDVEAAAYKSLEAGGIVEGHKLVEKRATRKWAIDDTQIREYLSGYGLSEDQFAPRSFVSPAQADKLLKSKKASVEEAKVTRESSGYTIAPETDKRPAVSLGRDLSELASFIKK